MGTNFRDLQKISISLVLNIAILSQIYILRVYISQIEKTHVFNNKKMTTVYKYYFGNTVLF